MHQLDPDRPIQIRSGSPPNVFKPCDVCQISREADHRIANHLALLAAFVRLKAGDLAQRPRDQHWHAEALLLLESIAAQIETVGRLHRALAHESDLAPDLGDHLRGVCNALGTTLAGELDLQQELPLGLTVCSTEILPITQIVAEAIVNAAKYARRRPPGPMVKVSCGEDGDHRRWISVTDNGYGLPPGFDAGKDGGLGFRLMRSLAAQLGAELNFFGTSEGLSVRLVLPLQQP